LQENCENDDGETEIKIPVEVFVFLINDKSQQDPVHRLEIITEVHRKRRNMFQGIGRQLEGPYGANPGQEEQPG
jgi:hypothetical protein